ncbi:MAG: glycosyltransferase family 8 protein [Lachnospira sp.]|nr:glycosyltransferase family 8 protein [Lachnospira sp.]
MNNKEIPIFFTIDNGYAPYLGVAISSMIKNASKDYNYRIIVLHQDLSEENQAILSAMATDNFVVDFRRMEQSFEAISDRKENRLRSDFFTLTIYFRLFIPEMFPEYDKGIYIDSDIVVPGDISKLYNEDISDYIIGAVNDISIMGIPVFCKYLEDAVGVDRTEYINSGMLLMNMKKMRELNFEERFMYLLEKYHFDSVAPDQDYINAMCNGKIKYLPTCWDAMPAKGEEPMENPMIIHYNLFDKPWCYDNIQYEDVFWDYASKTPYYETIKAAKAGYTDEQKKDDAMHLNMMLSRAQEIMDETYTFKKALEDGEKIRL